MRIPRFQLLLLLLISIIGIVKGGVKPPPPPPAEKINYLLFAVSGTLEDGFELRGNLDFWPNRLTTKDNNGRINATFMGNALVRGYKAYLDIKNLGWREYKDPPLLATVNPAIYPSGCDEHANQYAVYLADARQVINALAGEPRFLGIAPDMGQVDLTSNFTSASIKALATAFINADLSTIAPKNMDRVSFFTVTSTYKKSSMIASPPIQVLSDGTIVTDYPKSVGIWSGCGPDPRLPTPQNYSECISKAIRAAEAVSPTSFSVMDKEPDCLRPARYGVDKSTSRMNTLFEACAFVKFAKDSGAFGPSFNVQGCNAPPPPAPARTRS